MRARLLLGPLLLVVGCADDPPPPVVAPPPIAEVARPDEKHLIDVRQLTFGGENVGEHWSWANDQLVLQARPPDDGHACFRVTRATLTDPPTHIAVVEGEAPSFLPGNGDVVYAASPSCAKRAVHGDGVVLLDPSLDLFRARTDGSSPTRLTETPGYDAEPSVCGTSGAIVFTSMRDGDPDLYRMDADGGHVTRLTATPGYDGGAVFDASCAHIAWSAWHPKGAALEDYTKRLAGIAARPLSLDGKLELWIANADGTDARQVTYLDARSWAPSWFPKEARLLFASSFAADGDHDPGARGVDLWAIDLDGTNLERVTTAPGLDSSPAFSPDGKSVAFASARATLLGKSDVNAFVAHWSGAWRHVEEEPADHLMGDSAWLADHARGGRALGSKGLEDAGAYIERSLRSFGLVAGGDEEFRQAFEVTTQVTGQTTLEVTGLAIAPDSVRALGFSSSRGVEGPLVYVGDEGDYAHVDVHGKVVAARAGASPRHEAWLAHQHGAVGFIAISGEPLRDPAPESSEGLPAVIVASSAMAPAVALAARGKHPLVRLAVTLAPETTRAFNVVGRWKATAPEAQRLPGVVVVGAHYDGLGALSPGADDNASGTAALLQVARLLGEKKPVLRRDILLVAFSGEEQGAAGASAFVKKPPGGLTDKDLLALIDLDMVGRMRDDTLQVFGADTASEWTDLLRGSCDTAGVDCVHATGGGLGGADRRPFFEAHIPAVHLFTGVHVDHRQLTDTPDKLNATGMAQVARITEQLARDITDLTGRLSFSTTAVAPAEGEFRGFGASLGTIPDAAPPPGGQKGMLLAGVRAHGPADAAGLRKGDILIRLGGHVVGGTDDVKFVMTQSSAGAHMTAVVLRDGKELSVDVTLDAPGKR